MDNEWKPEWRPSEKLIGTCAKCGREQLKKHMTALYIKEGGVATMRVLCHICHRCLPVLLDELEVSMPD
ncbi:MAG: hypothetical protein ACI4PO_03890 [Faecousia sp.]